MRSQALFKDIFRQIWSTRSRFFSIFAIIALGCGFFAGLKSTCPDMIATAQKYYTEYNLMDLNVKSTLGIAEEDLESLRNIRNIEVVQPGYYSDVFVKGQDGASVICHVMSIDIGKCENDDYVNRPRVVSGRLPDRGNECVVDNKMLTGGVYSLGDKITLNADASVEISDVFNTATFTIVGGVECVSYTSYERGSASIGNGVITYYMYVPQEAFAYEVYTEVFLTFRDTQGVAFNTDEYYELIDAKTSIVKEIAGAREEGRYNEIYSAAMEQINAAQKEIDQAQAQYDSGLATYNAQILSAQAQLDSGEADLAMLKRMYTLIEEMKEKYGPGISENYDLILEILSIFSESGGMTKEELQEAAKTVDELISYLGEKIASSEAALEEGKEELRRQKYTSLAQFAEAEEQINEGKVKIAEARAELAKLAKPSWYIFDRNNNPGYSTYEEDALRVDNIAKVFPFFFILVAALVCTTTMTRMVEEQRMAIGTLKALGYSRGQILMKYLLYASLASILGGLFGLCIGFKVFPTIIFAAYNIMYVFPPIEAPFHVGLGMASIVVSVLCTSLASFSVCYRALFDVPAALMRPKSPKAGKRILLERITFIWDRIGFLKKVTIRNILRYKKRMSMTIIGIAGCTALLFTGFGLQYAITEIVDLQYGNIFNYDLMAIYNNEAEADMLAEMEETVEHSAYISDEIYALMQSVSVSAGTQSKREVYLVVPEDNEKIRDFITFKHRTDTERVEITDEGAVICEKLAKLYSLKVGDKLRVSLSDTEYADFVVSDICENYTLNYIYISRVAYLKGFEEEAESNAIFINMRSPQTEEDVLATQLLKNKGILALSFSSEGGGKFRDIVSSLNYIVILIIVCAGALAFVVLYNLANINVTERIREIATIKVLGFYDREVSSYINRENTIASLIGIIGGLFLGIPLEKFVIKTAEVDAVMFVPTVDAYCYVFAAVLAALFTAVVNMVMHHNLKKVNMVESLKSVE